MSFSLFPVLLPPLPYGFILGALPFLKNLFIYLAALGLCCKQALSSCGERGLLFIVVRGLQ